MEHGKPPTEAEGWGEIATYAVNPLLPPKKYLVQGAVVSSNMFPRRGHRSVKRRTCVTGVLRDIQRLSNVRRRGVENHSYLKARSYHTGIILG